MENESNARDRIEAVIHLTGLKQYEFANKIGVSNGAISHITSPTGRKAEMTENIAYRIVQSFPNLNISFDWLMNGSGSMFNPASQQQPTLFDAPSSPVVESNEEITNLATDQVNSQKSSPVNAAPAKAVDQHQSSEPVKSDITQRAVDPQPIDSRVEASSCVDEITPKRELERIVMFYSDGTFVEYRPQK